MKIAEFLPASPNQLWQLASQMGIKYSICKCSSELTGLKPPWDIDSLYKIQSRFKEEGFIFYGLEGDSFNMDRIKLGLSGRDEDIELYQQMLRNMGELGIPLLCYNFMAGIGWHRSKADHVIRGGALTSHFDIKDVPGSMTEYGEVSSETMWNNYRYFIDAVMPVAEKYNVKMGLHPDDPPIPVLRGISRIFSSQAGIEKALELSDSPCHGVTYCQANFKLMGVDFEFMVKRLLSDKRLFFFHFRDVRGTPDNFEETFHDNGPTAMPDIIRILGDAGFDGPIRVDHVPSMAGEDNSQPGYGTLGRLFAVGYLKGILDTLRLASE